MDYRRNVCLCTAKSAEEQLGCNLHEFVNKTGCTAEKCRAAEQGKRPTWAYCLGQGDGNTCIWCRSMNSYCRHRTEEGECDHDQN